MTHLKTTLYFAICITLFFSISSCNLDKRNENNLIHINVSVTYPEKEIRLEEVADIEFLQIEVDDEFLFKDVPKIITTNKIIFAQRNNGDILVFSRAGKPLSKFNNKGGGPEDYPYIDRLLYDETSDEIYVILSAKIIVYSLSGQFKRMIPFLEKSYVSDIVNYNSELFLIHDDNNVYPEPFSLISKQDGRVVESIVLPNGDKVFLRVSRQEGEFVTHYAVNASHIIPRKNGFLLANYSIDTVYYFSHDKHLSPVLARKPEIHSMSPMVILYGLLEAGNYEFFCTNKFIVENHKIPVIYLMRDKKNGSIFRPKITINDFRGKEISLSPDVMVNTQDSNLGFIALSLTELQEANREKRLSGQLKELVDKSDEDGNDIYLLLHFK